MTLVVLQVIGQKRLVAQAGVVNKWYTCKPVAVFQFTVSLNVVLTTCEVPQEVTPVHPVALIGEEEL